MEPVLSARDLYFRYREDWVLKGVSFHVAQREIVGILGPNASGKTTLVRILDGILKPQQGWVCLGGAPLRGMRRREIARQVAVVPQEGPMLYAFTALEVVLMGRNPHLPALGFEGKRDLEIARRSLERTGCQHLAARGVNELSGGERQRVLIARALAQEPRVLLLDEPTVHLDLRHQLDLLDLLLRLHVEEDIAVVWVSHDLNLASLACRRLLLMKSGRIHAHGSPREVLTESHIREVYGRRVLVDGNPQSGTPRITPLIEMGRGKEKVGGDSC